jgi:Replication factor-A C terminal domain
LQQDHTGQQWLTAFEESGVKIIGKSAHELKQLENTPEFERIIQVHLTRAGKLAVK